MHYHLDPTITTANSNKNSNKRTNKIPRAIIMLLVATTFIVTISILSPDPVSGYLGPRYGKREYYNMFSGGNGKIGIPKSIVARSTGARFYAGTRYAGKRSSFQPSSSYYTSDFGEESPLLKANFPHANVNANGEQPSSDVNSNYDCFYIPYFGLRCGSSSSRSDSEGEEREGNGRESPDV